MSETKNIRGRRLTVQQSESARQRIRVGMILKRLQDHLEGKAEMSQTQAAAAKTLLDRAMPTLSSVEYTQSEELPQEGTIQERLAAMLKGNRALTESMWQTVASLVLEKPPESEEQKGNVLAALASIHPAWKRAILEHLKPDTPSEEPVAALLRAESAG